MKLTEVSRTSSPPLGDIRQELLERGESSRGLKSNKIETEATSENKVSKELLTDLLVDLGLVGVALTEAVSKLSGSSVSEVVTWLENRKQQDYVFSGLSHFTNASVDMIPSSTSGKREGSLKGSFKGGGGSVKSRASSAKGSVRATSTNGGSVRGSVTSNKGSAKGSATSATSAKGASKGSSKNNPMKTIEKLKSNTYAEDAKTEKNGKKHVVADDQDLDTSWGMANLSLSPLVELSDSSDSDYSQSSPVVSDSEEAESDYEEEQRRRRGGSSRRIGNTQREPPRETVRETPREILYKAEEEDEEEDEEEEEYDEGEYSGDEDDDEDNTSPTSPTSPKPPFNAFTHSNGKTPPKSEPDLAKIEEDEAEYDEDDEFEEPAPEGTEIH